VIKLRLPKLNNYLFNLREVSGNIKDDLDLQYPLKATRINDSHLWNNMFS
jgi:hypothetical protein